VGEREEKKKKKKKKKRKKKGNKKSWKHQSWKHHKHHPLNPPSAAIYQYGLSSQAVLPGRGGQGEQFSGRARPAAEKHHKAPTKLKLGQ
jgi:hypothetical protein